MTKCTNITTHWTPKSIEQFAQSVKRTFFALARIGLGGAEVTAGDSTVVGRRVVSRLKLGQ